MTVAKARIFPSIGVARLGNSPDEWYVGPELPGVPASTPDGHFKDGLCRIRRQAARFRVYGYDESDQLVGELTPADATIEWTVELANTKAAGREFTAHDAGTTPRNHGVTNRSLLKITPGPRTLTGPGQAAAFDSGHFMHIPVPLGDIITDADGRLLVLGGFGTSAGLHPMTGDFANNDGWYDDVSDGPVSATVKLTDGTVVPVLGAWVLCVPPDFAPGVLPVTTFYDVLYQRAVNEGKLFKPTSWSFTEDVWPILHRARELRWVTESVVDDHHAPFEPAGFGPSGAPAADATAALARLSVPPPGSGGGDMPMLWSDDNNTSPGATLTQVQYDAVNAWATGGAAADWPGAPPPPPNVVTPDGLTRAALENCVGAALYPGIESSIALRERGSLIEPFRVDPSSFKAGDLTQEMALPWQSDFTACEKAQGMGAGGMPGEFFAWWPSQRPDDVYVTPAQTRVWTDQLVASREDMVANWSKLGFVTAQGAARLEQDRGGVVCTDIYIVTDRAQFARDEVAAVLAPPSAASFPAAVYVIAQGFLPSDLGYQSGQSQPPVASVAPTLTFTHQGAAVAGMSAKPTGVLFELPALPANVRQRITFVYEVEFQNLDGFPPAGTETSIVDVAADQTVSGPAYHAASTVLLESQPSPYLLDGPITWLSTDLRVFKVAKGEHAFGQTMGTNGSKFIKQVLDHLNTAPNAAQEFGQLPTDEQAAQLELARTVAGRRVFNFAVAKVHYRAATLDAVDTRVFFRLFATATTGTVFEPGSAYRTSKSNPIALLGLESGQLVTIPCFADPRVAASHALTDQADPYNVHTLVHSGSTEIVRYYGCWLDFNQTEPRFPLNPPAGAPNGPWPAGTLHSIQGLIRGTHQCLVAEINLASSPIPIGATPAGDQRLAQRNLAIQESHNPGTDLSRTVAHTFEIKTTHPAPRVGIVAGPDAALTERRRAVPAGPDELLIQWLEMPAKATAKLYIAAVTADEIMAIATQTYDTNNIDEVDQHTIGCAIGDVTFVPIPTGLRHNTPALLSIQLPPAAARRGKLYKAIVHQISGRPRRIVGSFQFSIPITSAERIAVNERPNLAVLRRIARAIPIEDRWYPVFERYVQFVDERLRALGDRDKDNDEGDRDDR